MKKSMGEERVVDGINPIKEKIGNKQAIKLKMRSE